jgi:hypothetical protein
MPELKLDFKNLGPIRLMPLDTSGLFLPFGRPIADYLQGVVGNQNGARTLLRQGAIDFSPLIRWTESTAWTMRTTGFGELERSGIAEAPAPADPAVADFLPMPPIGPSARDVRPANISVPTAVEEYPISKPRIAALPLRPRMTFGPPPAAKAKAVPTPAPAPKPVLAPTAAKPVAPVVAPPKPSPIPAPKVVTPVKVTAPTPPPLKPVTVIPPAPKPSPAPTPGPRMATPLPPAPAPASRIPEAPSAPPVPKPVVVPASPKAPVPAARALEPTPAPAARTPEPTPAPVSKAGAPPALPPAPIQVKAIPGPVVAPPPARAPDTVATTAAAPPVKTVAAPAPPKSPAVPVAAVRSPAPPVQEPQARVEIPKPVEPPPSRPAAAERPPVPSIEPHLTLGDNRPESLLERIPMALKLGVALLMLLVALYFAFGRSSKSSDDGGAVAVGEQGWSTEQVSDPVGSRHGRQLTIYRPSVGMSDYQLQFTGQIETKALGWFFRETDTQNYYAMKIENLAPGKMAITHFAVVEGRESGYSQRPLAVDARPGVVYRVSLDVTGPRFTVNVGGEPVDFWTDNRLKTGAVGFMSERDERGATSAVRFSFPKGSK